MASNSFRQRSLLLLLALILVYLQARLWFGHGSWEEITQLKREVAKQEAQNEKLRERNEHLYREVESLKHDLSQVEERARRELGLIKEGETFFQIVEPPEAAKSQQGSSQ